MSCELILEERLTATTREAFPELQESATIEMPGSVSTARCSMGRTCTVCWTASRPAG